MLASETAEKPRVKPSPQLVERAAHPARPSKPEALPPELLDEVAHPPVAESSAPWQVRHASRIRIAALVGITGGLAGLALYGWNTLAPSEPPAQTAIGKVQPAPVPAPAPVIPASASRTPVVTHTRGGAAATAPAVAAVPQKPQQVERNPNCAEGIAALGLCK